MIFAQKNNFIKHSREIQEFLRPSFLYLSNVEQSIKQALKLGDIKIGMHIRRGDYKNFEGGKYYYSIAEYSFIMRSVLQLFTENVVFVVCSNEKLSDGQLKEFHYIFGPGNEIEDLSTLAQSDYIIGPPSTYSMWASFYGSVPLFQIKFSTNCPNTLSEFKVMPD